MKRSGFSLIELIIVIAIIVSIAGIIMPQISGTKDAADDQVAQAKVMALELAMSSLRMRQGDEWTAAQAASDEAKYLALRDYLSQEADTWAGYQDGYTFVFEGNLTEGVSY
jgi:prepilin-type N-terminal cleavage/methylation domain-containing protein